MTDERTAEPARPSRLAAFASTILAASLLPWPATAEPEPLDPLVVTATRVETPTSKVGSAISAITADDLRRLQIQRVEDALDLLPGVTVRRTGAPGTPAAISLRGLSPRNTLVLLDGVELGDPSRAQVIYEFGTIPVEDIERIEVLRGPQSTLYGSDASGGVINIITRQPSKPFEATAAGEVGSYLTRQGYLGARGRSGRFSYGASAYGFATNGFSSFNERRGGVEADAHRTHALGANFGAQWTDWLRTDLWIRQSEAVVDYDQTNADLTNQSFVKRERLARAQATIDSFAGRWRHTIGVSHTGHERDYKGFENPGLGDQFDGEKQKIDYQSVFRLAPGHSIVAGLESEWESIDQKAPAFNVGAENSVVDADARTVAGYAEYRGTFLESVFVTAGLRHDDHDRFGDATTWRVTAAYLHEATATKVRASYGTGFVTPSLFELFDPCLGNGGLRPEKSRGWDAGLDQYLLGGRVVLSATYFDSRIDDQIRFDFARPSASPRCPFAFGGYSNIEKVASKGVELEARARLTDTVRLSAHYTYTDATNRLTGDRLREIPEHQGSLAIDWRFLERASLGVGVRFRGETESGFGTVPQVLGAFATVDARIGYQLTDWIAVYGRVVNLLDTRYEETAGIGTQGRSGYVGVRIRY